MSLAVLVAPLLAACAVTMPMSSMMPEADDVTGSLADVPFGQLLDKEDQRRERAALATALDPQGDGATVRWENSKSRTTGAITAKGHAYPRDAKVCRAFVSTLDQDGASRKIEGTACTAHGGEWSLLTQTPNQKKA